MKNLYLLFFVALIASCKKDNTPKPFIATKAVVKDAGLIAFKAAPLADNQVKISFSKQLQKTPSKIILKLDTATLVVANVTSENSGVSSATVTYPFKPGVPYNFVVQAAVGTDTIYQYTIPSYNHQYVSAYNYKQVLQLHQSLGTNAFDISPSRNYLFITDDVANTLYLKRINLQTLAVEDIGTIPTSGPIRAIADDELLRYGDNSTENVPATSAGGTDQAILARYNVNTHRYSFVDFVSSGYGRISRVINNHVLVINPIYTAKTASLINLGNLSRVQYPLNDFDFTRIYENSFGHILYNGMLVNTSNGAFSNVINLDANSGLLDVDDVTGYVFTSSYQKNAAGDPLSGFNAYKSGVRVFQSDYVYGRSFSLPIIFNIKNDVVIYYQWFPYDTRINIDGYYSLNLKTGESKLIQDDSDVYVRFDFQQPDGSVISVHADGVYKLTLK